MAKAELVPPTPAKPDVKLTLTHEEAQALADVTMRIGGDGRKSRRRFFDNIRAALSEVGVHANNPVEDVDVLNRAIYFVER